MHLPPVHTGNIFIHRETDNCTEHSMTNYTEFAVQIHYHKNSAANRGSSQQYKDAVLLVITADAALLCRKSVGIFPVHC